VTTDTVRFGGVDVGRVFVCCLLLAVRAAGQVNTERRYRAVVFCDKR
jgi:hypothetical protein